MLLSEFCSIVVHVANVNSLRSRDYMAVLFCTLYHIYHLTSIFCGECPFNVPRSMSFCAGACCGFTLQ